LESEPNLNFDSNLQLSLSQPHPEILKLFYAKQSDLSHTNITKWSYLDTAISKGHFPFVQMVLDSKKHTQKEIKKELNRKLNCHFLIFIKSSSYDNKSKKIPYHCKGLGIGFVSNGKSMMTDLLEKSGGTIHGGEILGLVEKGDTQTIEYILKNQKRLIPSPKPFSFWTYQQSGYTALILAVEKDNPKMVEFLLQKGADKNSSNKEGKRAIDFVKDSENGKKIRELLEK
ncbi:MAG: ankyrin repeat domain-containing protein, partial [Leptospiraceae bacterium]|nr:ankyrin repeat domain-containing protein [Leptospiraceae bacterium]